MKRDPIGSTHLRSAMTTTVMAPAWEAMSAAILLVTPAVLLAAAVAEAAAAEVAAAKLQSRIKFRTSIVAVGREPFGSLTARHC